MKRSTNRLALLTLAFFCALLPLTNKAGGTPSKEKIADFSEKKRWLPRVQTQVGLKPEQIEQLQQLFSHIKEWGKTTGTRILYATQMGLIAGVSCCGLYLFSRWFSNRPSQKNPTALIYLMSPKEIQRELARTDTEYHPEPQIRTHHSDLHETTGHDIAHAVIRATLDANETDPFVPPRMLLVGPPGSGKLRWAQQFARETQRTLVMISGAALTDTTAVDELIAWAQKQKDLLICIDAIETIYAARTPLLPTQTAYKLVTHTLLRLKQESTHIIMGITSRPEALDGAAFHYFSHVVTFPARHTKNRLADIGLTSPLPAYAKASAD